MNVGKVRRYLWYRLARTAPTSGSRAVALRRTGLVEMGADCYVGPNVTITPLGRDDVDGPLLRFGDRSTLSPDVKLLCSMHPEESRLKDVYGSMEPITVEHDAWIGAGASILGGTTVGHEAVVGAGAVVTEDVEPRTVVGGVPAEKIKDVEGLESIDGARQPEGVK